MMFLMDLVNKRMSEEELEHYLLERARIDFEQMEEMVKTLDI